MDSKKWREQKQQLQSGGRGDRMTAWMRLWSALQSGRIPLSKKQFFELIELTDADDDGVWRLVVNQALKWAYLQIQRSNVNVAVPELPLEIGIDTAPEDDDDTLSYWLWDVCRSRTLLLKAWSSSTGVLDGLAGQLLTTHFAKDSRYELVDRDVVLGDQNLAGSIFSTGEKCLCFIGPLNRFGDDIVKRYALSDARFKIGQVADLPQDMPNAANHFVIVERPATAANDFRTEFKDGRRRDFGLLQRYAVGNVVVMVIAGTSEWGTRGMVEWATRILPEPNSPGESPIDLPKPVRKASTLEAVVAVESDDSAPPWQPNSIDLVSLHLDRSVWSMDDRRWHVEPPQQITVVHEEGRPSQILFDGRPSSMRSSSDTFRLLVDVCTVCADGNTRVVDMKSICHQAASRSDGPRGEKEVRRNLSNLKIRYLGSSLVIDDQIILNADVQMQHDPPPTPVTI